MKRLIMALCAVALAGSFAAPAFAQYYREPARARVAGTIVYVRGHLVTIQQSERQMVIDDQPALDRRMTGRVAVGRAIIAFGYWNAGVFYATEFE